MRRSSLSRLKVAFAGLAAIGLVAVGGNAQAITVDAGVFAPGNGDAANPVVINISNPTTGVAGFLDTINFDLGSFTHFNMTSTLNNVYNNPVFPPGTAGNFGVTIFENNGDTEIPVGNGYNGVAQSFTNVLLADLSLPRDYHLHPSGTYLGAEASYTLTMWGSFGSAPPPPPVPVPAAVYLFGTGLVGLAGLSRRMKKVS